MAHLTEAGTRALRSARVHFGIAIRITTALTESRVAWWPLSLQLPVATAETIVYAQHKTRRQIQVRAHALKARADVLGLGVVDELVVAEEHAREALRQVVVAYNYLEDTAYADACHGLAHEMGSFTSMWFGCALLWEPEERIYWRTCPLAMLHLRFGMSPEVDSRRLCSICGLDAGDCFEHRTGLSYPVTATTVDAGGCSICWQSECVEHLLGRVYQVRAYDVLVDMLATNVGAVAAVDRPRDPLARWERMEFPIAFLREKLGFEPAGEPQECSYCIEPCKGLISLDQYVAGRGVSAPVDGSMLGDGLTSMRWGH